ncbi:zinc finger protein 800a isoform X2 [Latimeria chalumnae]|uniref:Zinc finger protein 800 n=2 Tax=Latimeria chalumnae TaxID=7897 RepID=H3AY57_LATCH|nr:PREDICTED: zinc finger protein 800 [Latimeria chalumnae]XP_005994298.1 PREDICTED: zinc finger protein 800 [Latimeria chalumnae]XP_005994299.1 PREDICTED: zinc finger protein 800 [Latimeria chalumnae]XP_005994300.1 PREDICTED: zinc finger protein 800 [Latimeria chalumnae]|eukprot:XP_005994297.1 PREDICTED: zinc finger protein 800 [Latimeria chalumnae]
MFRNMERSHANLRKTSHFLRNQQNSKNEVDMEESRPRPQKTPVRDKCCQTDHHHHSCCEPAYTLEPGDPPLLQQQLQTSKSGIQQIIECFRSGTKHLKHILLKEVDTIFECKLCRSLFRGLPNLITHKEFYCFPSIRMDENPPDVNDKQSQTIRDLLEAIYPRVDQQEYVIKLEPIETNQNAVFQYVSRDDDPDHISEESNTENPNQTLAPEPNTEEVAVIVPDIENIDPLPTVQIKKEAIFTFEEEASEPLQIELDGSDSTDGNSQIDCCLCGKEFTSRRGVRRHIKKVHKKKMKEVKKYISIKRNPTETSFKRGHSKNVLTLGRSCPVCHKSFATKANVRRHFDEVHRGLRRDSITPDIATRPGQPLFLGSSSSQKSLTCLSRKQKSSSNIEYNLTACKCLLCKRKYSSKMMLKRHMLIVHKIHLCGRNAKEEKRPNNVASNTEIKVKLEVPDAANHIESSSSPITHSPQNEVKNINQTHEKKSTSTTQKIKTKQEQESPKLSSPPATGGQQKIRKPKLSVGFDFKQLYCKLCKRQFTSKQNLRKHIELHTDGNNIYVKFYRCPLCIYETRRKRDVIRHITVVHKKSSRYLGKITANLESRAIKKPIEFVLNKIPKRGLQRDETKPLVSKQESTSKSPDKKYEPTDVGIEVKVTKNFSLHKCNKCGKAFAKKIYLEHHKKTHKNSASNSPEETKTKGRSTRSKAVF